METVTLVLIALVLMAIGSGALALAAWLRDDVRMILYSKVLIPVMILAGRYRMLTDTGQKKIYTMIRELPGVSYSRLLVELQLDDATLVHHLTRFLKEEIITVENEGGILRFSPAYVGGTDPGAGGGPPLTPLEKLILHNLRTLGPAARTEIQFTLKVPAYHVGQSLANLKQRGLIDCDGEGTGSYCWALVNPPKLK